MERLKKTVLALVLAALAASSVFGKVVDRIVAQVNDDIITLSDINREMADLLSADGAVDAPNAKPRLGIADSSAAGPVRDVFICPRVTFAVLPAGKWKAPRPPASVNG